MNFSNQFIIQNNQRILSAFIIQERYVPERKCPFTQNKKEAKKKEALLKDKEKEWLMAVYHHQYKKTLTEINQIISLPNSSGSRINNDCVKKNLIKIVEISVGKGRPKKYPVLLPDAYKILGTEEKRFYGKGAGYEHVLYQHLITEHFKKYNSKIELYRVGKHIDIAIETNDKFFAIEVEMTSVHAIENIKKDIENARADFVLVACKDNKVLKEVQIKLLELQSNIRNKTKMVLISSLLKNNPDEIIKGLINKEVHHV